MKPVIGHTYQLKEPDYRFGVGPILVTVTRVLGETTYDREPWWLVQGFVAVGTADNHGGWQRREFLEIRGNDLHFARIVDIDAS